MVRCGAILFTFLLAMPASADTDDDPAELARTWADARVYLPEDGVVRHTTTEDLERWFETHTVPAVVLYAHGCDGLSRITDQTGRFLAGAGYPVVAPDSFAREDKPTSCDPTRHRGGLHRAVLGWRQAEMRHALDNVRALPGLAATPIILMGHSEGGITVATLEADDIDIRIIEGWTCHAGWPEYRGLKARPEERVLALVGREDPWFRLPVLQGDCGAFMDDNDVSHVFEPPGYLGTRHWLSSDDAVQTIILDFIKN